MDLTADHVIDALTLCSGKVAARPDDIVDLVHRAEPGLAATLFSAWEAAGLDLSPALHREVEVTRRRMDFYLATIERIRAKVPELGTIKGLEVADLYPAGLVRNMSDIDLIAPTQAQEWDIVSLLMQDGWDIDSGTAVCVGGALRVLIGMSRPHEDRCQAPYSAEISTFYTLGNLGGIPPVLSLPAQWRSPAVKNLLMLLNERYEQPFRAKDLIDCALLHAQLRGTDLDVAHQAVIELCLAAEYRELASLVRAAGLATLPPLPGGRRTVAAVRARRIARQLSGLRRPLAWAGRNLQRRQMQERAGRAESIAWQALSHRMRVASAMRSGLVAFGLPLEGPPPNVTAAVLRCRGRLAWVDTPVARLLLTIADDVPQSAVDELSLPSHQERRNQ